MLRMFSFTANDRQKAVCLQSWVTALEPRRVTPEQPEQNEKGEQKAVVAAPSPCLNGLRTIGKTDSSDPPAPRYSPMVLTILNPTFGSSLPGHSRPRAADRHSSLWLM